MTRDEILNMPAGRELDALIAEKVMGLKVDYEFDEVLEPRVPFLVDKYDEWGYLPNYSTDIAAAWQVVERFESHCTMNNVHGIWECYLPDFAIGKDKTAPLAICRAALLAVMGDE